MNRWSAADIPTQAGRTALVTGATSGLGLESAIALAGRGARVLMTTRSTSRGEAALTRVRRAVPNAAVELVDLDLTSLASVRDAAAEVADRVPALDLLIDNAGVMAIPRSVTEDGFETQLATNHLGPFALTGLLLPVLLAAAAPRVVVLSSSAHQIGKIRFDDLQGEQAYGRWRAYGQSKLANLLFAAELQRRAEDRLLVASAHPGYARTELQHGQGSPLLEVGLTLGGVLSQSAAAGARPQLYAATMPDVRPDDFWGPALGYRGWPVRVKRAQAAQDTLVAHRLWVVSEDLTGVTYDL